MIISDWTLFAAAASYALPVGVLLLWKPILGVAFALIPIGILMISHGPSAIYALVVSTFVFMPLHGTIALLPADLVAIVLVVAFLIDLLIRGRCPGINRLARPFLLYLSIVLLSIVFSGITALSVRFFLRQSLLIATFFAVSHFGYRVNVKHVLAMLVVTADLNSIYSLMEFLGAGGAIRAFGLAGRGYGDHVMLAFIISSVFYFWSSDVRHRMFWGGSAIIMVAALAATQTRASAITAGWALIVIVILAISLGRHIKCSTPKRSLAMAVILLLFIFPFLLLYTPVFEGITYRFGRIGLHASGTILLRMSLWKAALTAFWGNPIFGIGAGNFPNVSNWVPGVRFDPIFYMVSGLSAHAVIFTSLAETGMLGFLSMYYFFARAVKVSYQNMKTAVAVSDLAATHCLFIGALVILGSSIYAGSWFWGNNSYHMAIIFGLIASFRHKPEMLWSRGNDS